MEPETAGETVEDHRFWSCERKRPYESRRLARSQRKNMERRYGMKFQIYKCRYCRNFHLTKRKNGE